MSDTRIESGIETATMSVLRQLPRKSRIISPVRQAAMTASFTTPVDRGADEERLIGDRRDLEVRRAASPVVCASVSRTCAMMSSVDAAPVFRIVSSAARWPSTRTMLVWGG